MARNRKRSFCGAHSGSSGAAAASPAVMTRMTHLDHLFQERHEGRHGARLADACPRVQHDVLARHAAPGPCLHGALRMCASNMQRVVLWAISGHPGCTCLCFRRWLQLPLKERCTPTTSYVQLLHHCANQHHAHQRGRPQGSFGSGFQVIDPDGSCKGGWSGGSPWRQTARVCGRGCPAQPPAQRGCTSELTGCPAH